MEVIPFYKILVRIYNHVFKVIGMNNSNIYLILLHAKPFRLRTYRAISLALYQSCKIQTVVLILYMRSLEKDKFKVT